MIEAGFMLFWLLVGHAVADYLLQPPWLSRLKQDKEPDVRWGALALHGWAHALPVALVTLSPVLALAELILHPLIDRARARGWYGIHVDQSLHVACKVFYVYLVLTYS